MNHLIIFAHPNGKDSFGRALVNAVAQASHQLGVQTEIRDLYRLEFDPVLSMDELQGTFQGIVPQEIQQEQQFIQQADLITLIYPLWWMGFPAILKGYLDRVLTHGFAYKTDETGSVGLLQTKKMQQFITIGNNVADYEQRGFVHSLNDTLINGLFNYCGIHEIEHQFFGDIYQVDDEIRQQYLATAAEKTTAFLTALS